jgi:hypothetical protein
MWYKNLTSGFIDTDPPKNISLEKKMPLLQDVLIRLNKMIDIGFITTIYFIMGAIVANTITGFQNKFDSKESDKYTLIKNIFSLVILIWINGVLIYIARNVIEFIPYPFDNYFGFHHKKVKGYSKIFKLSLKIFLVPVKSFRSRIVHGNLIKIFFLLRKYIFMVRVKHPKI